MVSRNDLPATEQGLILAHFLTVRDVARQATGMLQGIFADPPTPGTT